jgi:hypothetical protein
MEVNVKTEEAAVVAGLPAAPQPERAGDGDEARVKLRQLADRLSKAPGSGVWTEYLRLRRALMR